MIEHISVSQIRQWLKCQRQWWFKYIRKEAAKYSVRMALGIGVHAGIAQINAFRQRGVEPDMGVVEEVMSQTFEEELGAREYVFDELSTPAVLHLRGQRIVRAIGSKLDNYTGLPMLVEHKIDDIPIVDNVKLTGYIDLVDVNGSIYDFKVGARAKTQAEVDQDLQLSIYNFMIHGNVDRSTKVSLISVDSKAGNIKAVESLRTGQNAMSAFSVVSSAVSQIQRAIETDVYVPNVEGWQCSDKFCEYWDSCPYRSR